MPHISGGMAAQNEEAEMVWASGNAAGRRLFFKFGSNGAVPNGSSADVTTNGAIVWPTTAETIRVKAGGDAADTAAGNGARTVVVEGLDQNWELTSTTLTLAGANASAASSGQFRRIYRAYVSTAGAYTGTNTGLITIENTSSTQVLCTIEAGIGQTMTSQFTVPAGYTGYINSIHITSDATKSARVYFWRRSSADTVSAPYSPKRLMANWIAVSSPIQQAFHTYITLPEKTDIWVSAYGNGAQTTLEFSYDIAIVKQ